MENADKIKFDKQIMLFLSLMDTIHDFANTSRVEKAIKISENDDDEDDIGIEMGSTAFLIDFLMLGLFQDRFRELIGLDRNKNYIKTKEDCSKIAYRSITNHSQTNSPISLYESTNVTRRICEAFYLPTYAQRILYRSEQPERITKDVLFKYLSKYMNRTYNEIYADIDDIRSGSCVKLHLGNKGVNAKPTKIRYIEDLFKQNSSTIVDTIPEKYADKEDRKKLKPDYEVYRCVEYKEEKLYFKSKPPSKLYAIPNEEQGLLLYSKLKTIFNAEKIIYITDENQMDNKWFKSMDNSHYVGKFMEYDAGASKGISTLDFSNPVNNKKKSYKSLKQNFTVPEFQSYSLKKVENELLLFDELGCMKDTAGAYGIYFSYNGNKQELDLEAKDDIGTRRGLPLFLIFIDEINKKTMEFKSFSHLTSDVKEQLLNTTKNVALHTIEYKYKLTLKFTKKDRPIPEKPGLNQLTPHEFVLALFDLKRSMDYLFVKACYEANHKSTSDKYVFVSGDRSAVCYSLFLGNPTILTPPVATTENTKKDKCQRGEHYIILYNPDYKDEVKVNNVRIKPNSNVKPNANVNVKPNTNVTDKLDDDDDDDEEELIPEQKPETPSMFVKIMEDLGLAELIENPNDSYEKLLLSCKAFVNDYNTKIAAKERKISVVKEIRRAFTKEKVGSRGADPKYDIHSDFIKNMVQTCNAFINIKNTKQQGGGTSKPLNEKIPLHGILNTCVVGSPMYILFNYYQQLTSEIPLFWFIVFKSLLYFDFGDDMAIKQYESLPTIPNVKQNVTNSTYTQPVLLRSISSPERLQTYNTRRCSGNNNNSCRYT